MNKIETVTRELLERELNSRRFLAGLEKVIELAEFPRHIINGTRLEISFDVDKQLFGEGLNYSPEIVIGNERSVSMDIGEKFAEELYRKHTGKDPGKKENDDDFANFCSRNKLFTQDYPYGENLFDFDYSNPHYTLFNLHTHPLGGPYVSPGDGKYMTFLRNQTREHGLFVRPVMMVVGCTKYDSRHGTYPILFFQEKNNTPLDEQEVEEAVRYARRYAGKNERCYDHGKREIGREELARLLMRCLGKGLTDVKEREYRPLYNCGLAYFTPGAEKLDFDFDLNDFAYSIEAGGKDED